MTYALLALLAALLLVTVSAVVSRAFKLAFVFAGVAVVVLGIAVRAS